MKKALLFVLTALLIAVNGFGQNIAPKGFAANYVLGRGFYCKLNEVMIVFKKDLTVLFNNKLQKGVTWGANKDEIIISSSSPFKQEVFKMMNKGKRDLYLISTTTDLVYRATEEFEPGEQ